MGRAQRPRPIRLAAKLLEIRHSLHLSQEQMFKLLDCRESPLYARHLSDFELGKREPPLPLLLRYAKVAGVPLEVLADDELNLPKRLPNELGSTQHVGKCPYCGAGGSRLKKKNLRATQPS
jgi:transcriptional regulator with XRE-family HTH domain